MIAPNWLSKPRVVAVVDADRFLLFRVDYRRRKQSAEPYFEHRGLDAGWAWLATAATEAADEGLVPPEESIDLVLMRPLVSTRALALPPCRRSILRALLGANLNRYFPWGDDAAVVDAWSSRQHGKRRRHVAAAGVSAETVAGILDALTAGGLRIRRVLAAPMAAAHAVGQLQRETNGRLADAVVVVFGRDLCELIGFVDGEPTSFIPLPMGASVETDATALDHALEVMTEPSEPSPGPTGTWPAICVTVCQLAVASAVAWAMALPATGRDICTQICLPFQIVDPILKQLKHQQLLAFKGTAEMGDYEFTITEQGRDRGLAAGAARAHRGGGRPHDPRRGPGGGHRAGAQPALPQGMSRRGFYS